MGEDEEGEEGLPIGAGSGPDMSTACFVGHSDCVYSVAIHPFTPGVVLTGGGDDKAFLWTYAPNADGSEELGPAILHSKELTGHTDTVTSVGFNYDGKLALTGGYDGKINVWSVPEGELTQTLEGPEGIF
jgi:ribosome assembly protein SQT1